MILSQAHGGSSNHRDDDTRQLSVKKRRQSRAAGSASHHNPTSPVRRARWRRDVARPPSRRLRQLPQSLRIGTAALPPGFLGEGRLASLGASLKYSLDHLPAEKGDRAHVGQRPGFDPARSSLATYLGLRPFWTLTCLTSPPGSVTDGVPPTPLVSETPGRSPVFPEKFSGPFRHMAQTDRSAALFGNRMPCFVPLSRTGGKMRSCL